MQNTSIRRASFEDVPVICEIINSAVKHLQEKDWFVADDDAYIRRHIQDEGFTLLFMKDQCTAGYLTVRFPGDSPKNLGRYLHSQPLNHFSGHGEDCAPNDGLTAAPACYDRDAHLIVHMESTAVLPEFRGLHIFRRLLHQAVIELSSDAKIKGSHKKVFLMATVHPDNIFSKNAMEQEGFSVIAQDILYGGLPRLVMCRSL